ncbi:MAG: SRPBCC family protein [Armatimonadota bacterium]
MADRSRFVYVTYIRTTPERLWQALIEPELTRRYWAETWQESEWRQGAAWRLMIPDGRVGDTGEVLEIEPHRRLVLSWRVDHMPELQAEGHSRVTYELEEMGATVKLTFTQEMDRPDSQVIAVMSEGWPHLLASLKTMLETGDPLIETTKWPEGH